MDQEKQMAAQEYPEFAYVDIHRVDATGNRRKWKRIEASKLPAYRKVMVDSESQHCFSTIQRFANPFHEDGEEYLCDLFFDLDSDKDVQESLDDVRRLKDFFTIGFDLDDEVKYYYTGNRGFHIEADYRLFGTEPSDVLVKIWRHVAEEINRKLELKTFDRSVYSKRRMWRIPNTIHGKTGLYKIRLYPTELSQGIDRIKLLAKHPREDFEDGGNQ